MEFSTPWLEKLAIASCSVMLSLAVFNSCSGGISDVEDQELGSLNSAESATPTTANRALDSSIVVSPAIPKTITVPPTGIPGNIDSKETTLQTPTGMAIPTPLPTNTSSPTHTPTPDMFRGYDTPATATPTQAPTSKPTLTPTPTSLASATASVAVNNYNFSPSSVTIRSGRKVTWSFQSGIHTATGSAFNSGTKMTGQSFEYTFNSAGTYGYVCSFHGSMMGTVTVQ